jgi:hypothetical protein
MLAACLTLVLIAGAPPTFGAEKLETPHLAFMAEYVRELSAIETERTLPF